MIEQGDIYSGGWFPLCPTCGEPERVPHRHLSAEGQAIAAFVLSELALRKNHPVERVRPGEGRRPVGAVSGAAGGERLLTPEEAAERFGVTRRWILAHADEVGGRRLSRKTIRFPERALERHFRAGARG